VRNLITDVPGMLVGNAHDARAATGVTDPPVLTELGTVAADCLARAVARGVYEATALPYKTAVPDWKTRFGGGRR
jgi:L-aminopeptidase/D-esterase-like protein